ncbi:MAG: hypothetical protein C0608_06155 [Deltaproteobacteria bacterium]|nr:MAG: hypothetical protein C0608_06155 [Deltaproteobacteria bacterium]
MEDKLQKLAELVRSLKRAGASDARVVDVSKIIVDEALAARCLEPKCPNYGLALSCPPNVEGPEGMREKLKRFEKAVTLKLDVPLKLLNSKESYTAFKRLSELAVGAEELAKELGFREAEAYTGGSCKVIFCGEEERCQALSGGACRQPRFARRSMSGYGVDVTALAAEAGWKLSWSGVQPEDGGEKLASVYGLVLIY